MKLSNRLTRAGIVFIMLGTTAAMLPEVGFAVADTSQCPGQSKDTYTLGTAPNDTTSSANPVIINTGQSLTVSVFVNGAVDTAATVNTGAVPSGFSVTGSGDTVKITNTSATTGTVTLSATIPTYASNGLSYAAKAQ